ncbi:hypothetical protein BKA62DRAFT_712203, partial [Auriculariales sp. MPI-PUGE-AT-0066]
AWAPSGVAWTSDVSEADCPTVPADAGWDKNVGWYDDEKNKKPARFELDTKVAYDLPFPAENLENNTQWVLYYEVQGAVIFPDSIADKSDKDLDVIALLDPHFDGKAMRAEVWRPYKKGRCVYFRFKNTEIAHVTDVVTDGKRTAGKFEFLADPAKNGDVKIIVGGADAQVSHAKSNSQEDPGYDDSGYNPSPSESNSAPSNTASAPGTTPSAPQDNVGSTTPPTGSAMARFGAAKMIAAALAGGLALAVVA